LEYHLSPETRTRSGGVLNYFVLKYVHIVAVAASFALFFLRGLWVLGAYPPTQDKWARALPHAVDTLLLLSALGMLAMTQDHGWPAWLTVKLGLLVGYVLLGLYTLHSARTVRQKLVGLVLALLVYLFITTVAVMHHPLGIFAVT
jgi:uncharacterized membrane protein SirB2